MKTQLAAITGAALCMLAAGCGSTPAPVGLGQLPGAGLGSPPAARTTSDGGPTAAGNRRLAEREALRLLSLAPVPAHSVRLSSPPRSASWPAMGKPGAKSLVDQTRSWRLAMSFTAASAWITAHRPAGLHQAGVATTPPNGQPVLAYSYPGAASPAWGSAELDIEVVPAGQAGSVMRADGMAVWLDPVPIRDTAAGKRLRVLAAADCPATDENVVGVTNPSADLVHALLPSGPPLSGLTCTYYGMNGRPFRLRSQQRLSAAWAARLAASMSRMPTSHPIGVAYYCPFDDDSAELVALSYSGRADVDLWVYLNGCGGVTNGYIEAGNLLP